jgi:hypothetical protein
MEERNETSELHITEQLEGELDLVDFKKLYNIYISHYVDENKITFKNKRETKTITIKKYLNAQKVFDKEYPINSKCLGELDGEES